jgi:hypothetical protein
MRRRITWPDSPPAHLLKFKTSDWDTQDEREAFKLWSDACKTFLGLHGWPGGPAALLSLIRQTRLQLGEESAPEGSTP